MWCDWDKPWSIGIFPAKNQGGDYFLTPFSWFYILLEGSTPRSKRPRVVWRLPRSSTGSKPFPANLPPLSNEIAYGFIFYSNFRHDSNFSDLSTRFFIGYQLKKGVFLGWLRAAAPPLIRQALPGPPLPIKSPKYRQYLANHVLMM